MTDINKLAPVQEHEVQIVDLGVSGEGVGDIDGYKVFIDGALPGETVLVELLKVKPTFATGKLLKIVTPSPDRVVPVCPVYGKCGGCQIMHLSYEGQLKIKTNRVLQALKRIGHFENPLVADTVGCQSPLSYRNKIQLPVQGNKKHPLMGLYSKGTHSLVTFDKCYIHCEQGDAVKNEIEKLLSVSGIEPYEERTGRGVLRHVMIRSALKTEQVLVVLVTTGREFKRMKRFAEDILKACETVAGVVENVNTSRNNAILGKRLNLLAGKSRIDELILDKQFSVSATSFFQVNTPQAEKLFQTAIDMAELTKDKRVLDAYCGVGTLSLLAAAKAKSVMGVEISPEAIKDAKQNANNNKVTNAQFIVGKCEDVIGGLADYEVALVNPPRKGCEAEFIEILCEKKIPTVVYVSCNPATLARDAKLLCAKGYTLQKVQPVDMFPQTMHVESVACFKLSS